MSSRNGVFHGIAKEGLWECRGIWLACFAFLWPVAVAARLTGWRLKPWPAGSHGYRTAFSEARSMATSLVASVYAAH